jgi:hypothetical protein
MKTYLSLSIASILALSIHGTAGAQLFVTAALGGVPSVGGATLDNLDEASPSILSLSGAAILTTGPNLSPFNHIPPYFSGSTAAFFGEPTYTSGLYTGHDASQYIAVATGSATFTFSTPQLYFGLLWGSIGGDSLSFYDSANNLIGVVSGANVPGAPLDNLDNPNDTLYVNITSTTAFSKVIATTTQSFEFDDIAYAQVVPEPASTILLGMGLCLVGVVLQRRVAQN